MWLDAAKLDNTPALASVGLDFHPMHGMREELDRFSLRLLSVAFLCFALAFGALHAPSGFDLGQEIEN